MDNAQISQLHLQQTVTVSVRLIECHKVISINVLELQITTCHSAKHVLLQQEWSSDC